MLAFPMKQCHATRLAALWTECGTPGKHGQTASVPVGLVSSTETVPVMDPFTAEITVQDQRTKTKNASLKNVQWMDFSLNG